MRASEDVAPGSEIANIIGTLNLRYVYYNISCANIAGYREGNRELHVVASATWLLMHAIKFQPIHCHPQSTIDSLGEITTRSVAGNVWTYSI